MELLSLCFMEVKTFLKSAQFMELTRLHSPSKLKTHRNWTLKKSEVTLSNF